MQEPLKQYLMQLCGGECYLVWECVCVFICSASVEAFGYCSVEVWLDNSVLSHCSAKLLPLLLSWIKCPPQNYKLCYFFGNLITYIIHMLDLQFWGKKMIPNSNGVTICSCLVLSAYVLSVQVLVQPDTQEVWNDYVNSCDKWAVSVFVAFCSIFKEFSQIVIPRIFTSLPPCFYSVLRKSSWSVSI